MMHLTRLAAMVGIAVGLAACSGPSSSASSDDTSQNDTAAEQKKPARFTQMKNGPTDRALAALSTAGAKFDGAFLGTYRFNKAGPEHTDPAARETRVKEVMHRFMCSFFDDSIDLGRHDGASAVKQTDSDLDLDNNSGGTDTRAFDDALKGVFSGSRLDVMSGSASGNNTGGNVMGVYDVAHDEILYFGFTNCGSDN
jgi:hypothetical protein